MNLEHLKVNFFNYLQRIGKDDDYNLETSDDVDMSVFLQNGEFETFLSQDQKASAALTQEYGSYNSGDFDEIIKDIEEAQKEYDEGLEKSQESLQNDEEVFVNSQESSENAPLAETSDAPGESVDAASNDGPIESSHLKQTGEIDSNQDPKALSEKKTAVDDKNYTMRVKNTLDEMYQDEDVVKALDLDGDGALNDEEKDQFEAYAQGYDEQAGKLTKKALDRALEDIKSGNFSYDNDPIERAKALEEAKKAKEDETKDKTEESEKTSSSQGASASQGSGGVGGASYGGGVSGSSGGSGGVSGSTSPVEKAPTVEELEEQKSAKETELKSAQDEVSDVYSGENPAVSAAQDDMDKAQEDYEKALEEDENVSDELKERASENLEAIANQQSVIDGVKSEIAQFDNQITAQQSVVTADESNLNALKESLSALEGQSSDDHEKQAEIDAMKASVNEQIAQAEAQLETDKETLETYKESKTSAEEKLSSEEEKLTELDEEKAKIDEEILENCSEETKKALETYDSARENVENVKAQELETAQGKVDTIQKEIDDLNAQINELKAKETQKENSVSDFDFSDFDLQLSDVQEYELTAFKENWEQNQGKYQAVEDATGIPAELVAAIHWREGSGNFDTYLHNGDPLGQPTTHVPAGIYFETWEEAAIDAVSNHGGGAETIDPDDISTYYEYAEIYNGTGYRNKGINTPYVWAGTSNYSQGKYVADGVFDPSAVDQQLGVAVMLRELLS